MRSEAGLIVVLTTAVAACSGASDEPPLAGPLSDAAAEETAASGDAGAQEAADGGTSQDWAKTCLTRTPDEPHCKDCCDCASLACTELAPCRDACKTHDFSTNTNLIDVNVPSNLGPDGDYSACVAANPDEKSCKTCCECTAGLVCGDFQYCRTLCDNAYSGDAGLKLGTPQLLRDGFLFTEGPVWIAAKNVLLFSDIEADTIYQLSLPEAVTTHLTPSHRSNGLALDPAGLLLAAEYGTRSVTRTLPDNTRETVVSQYQGKQLNAPNDLAVRSDGTLYFSDPTFGMQGTSELGFLGVYRVTPQGAVSLEMESDKSPNGVALSPDEKRLYVGITFDNKLMAYDLAADGATSNPALFATVEEPDGICVSTSGRLYVAAKEAGAGALVVLSATGTRLATLPLPVAPTNCEIGNGGKTLFITARSALYRLDAPAEGF